MAGCRKSWRLLQSRAGVENTDYLKQKELLAEIDEGTFSVDEYMSNWQQY